MKFSVVIPVHNRASSILPTLESVRGQSWGDFECLVVDDGSDDSDALRAVVERLNDARFRYLRRPNGGASAARNTGMDAAQGDYIAFLDSDDRWLPAKLERDAEAAAPGRVLFARMLVDGGARRMRVRPRRGPRVQEDMSEYLARHEGFTPNSTIVVPAALARTVRYSEGVSFGDDTDFAVRLAAAGAEFHIHPEPLAVMADRPDPTRLSQTAEWRAVAAWLEEVRPLMTERAYFAYRGWHVARLAASAGEIRTALRLYAQAVAKRALPPRLAAKALLQILMPRRAYRSLQALFSLRT